METPARPPTNSSSLDSLRTVEFRQALRGYHSDDVDEYLERVAVEAEALQEQMRQATDRLKQAANRIVDLEQQLEKLRAAGGQGGAMVSADDALQKTLLLAQKFVDQTQSEAQAEARTVVSEAEERARTIVGDAEEHVRVMTEEAERHLRDEVTRLGQQRTQLAADVETIGRHLENERHRIRGALTEMLEWVDEHVHPGATLSPRSGRGDEHLIGGGAGIDRVDDERPSPVRDLDESADGEEPSGRLSFGSETPTSFAGPTERAEPVGAQAFSRSVASAPADAPREIFAPGRSPSSEPNGVRTIR